MVFMSRHNGFMGLGGNRPLGDTPGPSSYDQFVSALVANGGWFWDLTRADKLFQDSAGSTPVSALDHPIGRVVDVAQSTLLTQATSANRPLFKQGAGALFDGSNDGLASAIGIDLSGTNKVMVGAAIRKLSDSAFGMLLEHSATASSNNGSFYLAAPLNNSGTRFRWLSKGTTQQVVDLTDAGLAAPVSAVVSGVGDIGSNLARAFIDGAQAGENTSTQGTGNFGNYTFYLGRRGGASNPYNGYIAGLYLIPYIDNDLRALADSVMAQLAQGLPS